MIYRIQNMKKMPRRQNELPTEKDKAVNNEQVLREISKLKSWFNPDPLIFIEAQDSGRDLVLEKADVALNAVNLVEEPKTFEEAFYHPDADYKIK